ncbi:MAG: hypothetical protein PVI23_14260, partial [Maricaulaceae bacterium]
MIETRLRAQRPARRAARSASLFAAALMSAGMLAAAPAAAQDDWVLDWSPDALAAYDACLVKIPLDAETAYEDGLVFRDAGGGVLARHCIALALLEIGHTEEAAARLEEAAFMPDGGGPQMRAELLSQAGNAWLL